MRARYLTNACVLVETPDLRLLCDPWFTEGVYDGSWFHDQPVEPFCEPVDAVFVSHLHPDHYDPIWLRGFLETFPETPILIAEHDPPYLPQLMRRDGFQPVEFRDMWWGRTRLHARVARFEMAETIDSVLLVMSQDKSAVLWSDAPNDPRVIREVRELAGNIDLAFLPFSGAGPFPQCYDVPNVVKLRAAAAKIDAYAGLWVGHVGRLEPRFAVPYAGQFLLGGRFGALNALRGFAEPEEVPDATVLAPGGWIDVDGPDTLGEPFDSASRVASLADRPMVYDDLPEPGDLKPLLRAAAARNPVVAMSDYWLGVQWGDESFSVNMKDRAEGWGAPNTVVTVDPKHLEGLLSRRFHWNNAEIGSHLRYSQDPSNQGILPGVSMYLTHFHV